MNKKLQKLQFIDSARYMASSFSNLDDNLAQGINKIKCTKTSYLEHTNADSDLIEYSCLCCNKNYQKRL